MGDEEAQAAPVTGTGLELQTPLNGDEGEAMDIHRPKAAHSWREFLIEIGTIICGILIALGLEQAVEAVHRDAEIKEAREALNTEVALNLGVYQHFLAHRVCFDQRFDEIIRWAASPAAAHARRFPGKLPDPEYLVGSASDWSISTSAVSKMPFALRSQYALFYNVLSVDQRNWYTFADHWGLLQKQLQSQNLDDRERDDLVYEAKAARRYGDETSYNYSEFIQGVADKLHLKPNPAWVAPDLKVRAAEMCKPLLPASGGRS